MRAGILYVNASVGLTAQHLRMYWRWNCRIKRMVLSAGALAALCSPLAASGNPYEAAAKIEMEHLASSVLAASVCQGVHFNGESVIPHLAAAALLLGQKRAQDVFFAAMRSDIDAMDANGRELWCAATLKAAKDRGSDTITEEAK